MTSSYLAGIFEFFGVISKEKTLFVYYFFEIVRWQKINIQNCLPNSLEWYFHHKPNATMPLVCYSDNLVVIEPIFFRAAVRRERDGKQLFDCIRSSLMQPHDFLRSGQLGVIDDNSEYKAIHSFLRAMKKGH